MRQATLPLSELGLIAASRGIAGAGAGLLLAGRVPEKQRKMVGWGLFALGLLTTIPFVIDIVRKSVNPNSPTEKGEKLLPPSLDHQGKRRRTNMRAPISASLR